MKREAYLRLAIEQAKQALVHGDVPVGAVLVRDGEVIGSGFNQKEYRGDPTAHAEILALRDAAARLGRWRLDDTELYVTLEPCAMCAGAIIQARISRVVFGAWDSKGGALGSVLNLASIPALNHSVDVIGGILEDECGRLLTEFFRERRRESGGMPEMAERARLENG